MSKQHLADMLKNIANGNTEEAKQNFSDYAQEKSIEILNRDTNEPVAVEPAVVEPAVVEPVAVDPVVEPAAPADDTTIK